MVQSAQADPATEPSGETTRQCSGSNRFRAPDRSPGAALGVLRPHRRSVTSTVWCFSSAFRRMQDKTQGVPAVEGRLCPHAPDAQSRGLQHRPFTRHPGRRAGDVRHQPACGFESADFGSIAAAAACLAHDIGNPPFGHSGEDAIRHQAHTGEYGERRVAMLQGSEREGLPVVRGQCTGIPYHHAAAEPG